MQSGHAAYWWRLWLAWLSSAMSRQLLTILVDLLSTVAEPSNACTLVGFATGPIGFLLDPHLHWIFLTYFNVWVVLLCWPILFLEILGLS